MFDSLRLRGRLSLITNGTLTALTSDVGCQLAGKSSMSDSCRTLLPGWLIRNWLTHVTEMECCPLPTRPCVRPRADWLHQMRNDCR